MLLSQNTNFAFYTNPFMSGAVESAKKHNALLEKHWTQNHLTLVTGNVATGF